MREPEAMSFDTPITMTGPSRSPRNLLHDQEYDGHASLHDESVAGDLGLAGAPIEGPTHFSQFEPFGFALWGQRWYETGCVSMHFQTMVVEGEDVTARATTTPGAERAEVSAAKADGTPVCAGTITVGADASTALDERLATTRERDVGDLFIVDRLEVGMRSRQAVTASVDMDTPNGNLYPFSLRRKLDTITETSSWFDSDDTPWGRPVLPFEMLSVLAQKAGSDFPVRGPAVGLFLDLEVKLLDGPVFVGDEYTIEREVVALSQSRKVESHWVRSSLTAPDGRHVADVLLHSGVFKASYAGYPQDRLG